MSLVRRVQTFGNHEFDKGPSVLAAYLRNLKVPVATCNIQVTDSSNPLYGLITPGPLTTLLKLGEGQYVRIGICGFTTTDTPDISSPGPGIVFNDLVASVTACVQQLQASGVQYIIGLGHAGIPGGDVTVAANVPGLDLVVGGHSHTMLYNGTVPVLTTPTGGSSSDAASYSYPYGVAAAYNASLRVPYVQAFWGSRCDT